MRGGFGMYANWLTPANVQEEFRGNPPGLIIPTFFSGPVHSSRLRPGQRRQASVWIYVSPLAGSAICPVAPCLDSKGGIPGAAPAIGGINPNLKSPEAYIFSATLERRLATTCG